MKKIKVLMIDDNEELVGAVCEYFKNSDKIEVSLTAFDGEKGLELIKSKKDDYDIILLDLIMPKKDGLFILESMKESIIEKKIIVTTSNNSMETIREVSDYGVSYYLLKPFDLSMLEQRILDCVSRQLNYKVIDIEGNKIQS